MAKKKTATKTKTKAAPNRHKELDETVEDPAERAARVSEETSNDGKFSVYELAPKNDPRDGDTILQYRGEPKE